MNIRLEGLMFGRMGYRPLGLEGFISTHPKVEEVAAIGVDMIT